jgi:8-oxo-dGTP diphosphatase
MAREIREELGFAPTHEIGAPLMVTCTTTAGLTAGHTDVSLWYVLDAQRSQTMAYDTQEFNGVKWFEFQDAPLHRSDPHLERFICKLRSNKSLEPTRAG